MPVRSLSSSVLRWPERNHVIAEFSRWAEQCSQFPDVVGIGYFGSYAVGAEGVGSDLDIVLILSDSTEPFERRSIHCDTTSLPVPTDLLVYTLKEYRKLVAGSTRFGAVLRDQVIWALEPSPHDQIK